MTSCIPRVPPPVFKALCKPFFSTPSSSAILQIPPASPLTSYFNPEPCGISGVRPCCHFSPGEVVHGVERPRSRVQERGASAFLRMDSQQSYFSALTDPVWWTPNCNTEVLKPGSVLGDFDAFPKSFHPPKQRKANRREACPE